MVDRVRAIDIATGANKALNRANVENLLNKWDTESSLASAALAAGDNLALQPTDAATWRRCRVCALSPGYPVSSVSGFVPSPSATDFVFEKILYNAATSAFGRAIHFENEDGAESAINQIRTPFERNFVLQPRCYCRIVYDTSINRWRLFGVEEDYIPQVFSGAWSGTLDYFPDLSIFAHYDSWTASKIIIMNPSGAATIRNLIYSIGYSGGSFKPREPKILINKSSYDITLVHDYGTYNTRMIMPDLANIVLRRNEVALAIYTHEVSAYWRVFKLTDYRIDNARFFIPGTLSAATEQGGIWEAPQPGRVRRVTAYRKTPGSSGNTVVDVNKGGASVLVSPLSIAFDDANKKVEYEPSLYGGTSFVKGDLFTVDIDSVEAGTPADLSVVLSVEYTG